MHPGLLNREQTVLQSNFVAAAFQTRTIPASVLEHREDRLVQLEVEVQHARGCGLQAARCERGVDEPRDWHTGFVDDAKKKTQLLATIPGRNRKQDALRIGMRAKHRFRLREREIRRGLRQTRRPSERRRAQCAPEIRLREQRLQAYAACGVEARQRLLILEQRDARRFVDDRHAIVAPLREYEAGIDKFEREHFCAALTAPAYA